jgi:hypothetical protein
VFPSPLCGTSVPGGPNIHLPVSESSHSLKWTTEGLEWEDDKHSVDAPVGLTDIPYMK